MKIESHAPNLTQALTQTQPNGSSPKTGSPLDHQGDSVRISDMAAQLSADPQKLAQIEASLAAGAYQVLPSQIANSMINEALQP